MLLKLLLTAGLIYIAYVAFFKKPTLKSTADKKQPNQKQNNKKKNEAVEEMVECATCGTYISQEETILSMGKSFCSKECVENAS